MSFVRPELAAWAHRRREMLAGGAVAAAGLWLAAQGGWVLAGVGAALAAGGAAVVLTGMRRLRLARAAASLRDGPGVVEVVEGQVAWYGPGIGGYAALSELTALSLVTVAGLRCWRLDEAKGAHLLVPLGAAGAERLFDTFAALPGLSDAALAAAVAAPGAGPRVLWRRADPARGALPPLGAAGPAP